MAHAILAPSSAERWLNCNPSARLEQKYVDRAGRAADEGTLAHRLGETLLKQKTHRITPYLFDKEIEAIKASSLYTPAMYEHADDYATFVLERYSEALTRNKDAILIIEQSIDLSMYVPEGHGTGDAAIIADEILDFIDFKYGQGHEVSAVENKQMMLYALGLLADFDGIYRIKTVRMTIYQPRKSNISTWEIPVMDLLVWGTKELIPGARLAWEGRGSLKPVNIACSVKQNPPAGLHMMKL